VVDCGLVDSQGQPQPGKMCVEAAICYALGLPHGDNPPCVGKIVREVKIDLNDSSWSSPEARAKGLRRLAIMQLGSNKISQKKFGEVLLLKLFKQIVPLKLRNEYRKVSKADKAIVEIAISTFEAQPELTQYFVWAVASWLVEEPIQNFTDKFNWYYKKYKIDSEKNVISTVSNLVSHLTSFSGNPKQGDQYLLKIESCIAETLIECNSPGVALWNQSGETFGD
jgi:hypothetical protein